MGSEIKLGDKVKDSVTGFEGIVTRISEELNGPIECTITSEKLGEHGEVQTMWAPSGRLAIVSA